MWKNLFLVCGLLFGLLLPALAAVENPGNASDDQRELSQQERQRQFFDWLFSLVNQGNVSAPFPQLGNSIDNTTTSTTEAPDPGPKCEECDCGITNKRKRIVGGQETEVNQYPWMAQLLYNNRFYCGGSLINDRFVLTASHCIQGFNKQYVTVRLLDHSRSMSSPHKIDRKLMKATTHPNYNSVNYNNDIALLELDTPVPIKELLRPVCLPTPGKPFSGETGIATGWGATKQSGLTSDTLQEVHVPIMSNKECRKSRYGPSKITDNMICAGHEEGMKDSCQGDSGGPLHVIEGGRHHIVGIVSWGEGCAKAGYPGVYSRVNRYGTWIRSQTKNACYCKDE